MRKVAVGRGYRDGKNIVLLSDGTGNSSAALFRTNVWKLFQALDLRDPTRQIAFYDDGVGTSSFKLFAILGGIFGFGLKRNVLDIYKFCCRNYRAGDRIYGFGFSRGAFTIRIVAGLIAREGLAPYDGDEEKLNLRAHSAYRRYRRRFDIPYSFVWLFRWLRDVTVFWSRAIQGLEIFDPDKQIQIERIQFLGLWDTVDAYGGPIEEITRAIDYWFWPLSMPDRFLHAKVHRACHAVALDDERDAFRPVLWDERYTRRADGKLHAIDYGWQPDAAPDWANRLTPIDRKRLSQVWFTGVHSDVGGGYPQDGLSFVTLDWVVSRAEPYGLLIDVFARDRITAQVNASDKLNDSRRGLGNSYRYKPRDVEELQNAEPYKLERGWIPQINNVRVEDLAAGTPAVSQPPATIHQSVFDRIEANPRERQSATATDGYIPIGLPQTYIVAGHDGSLTSPSSPAPYAKQTLIWNIVWWKRVFYFLSVFAAILLVLIPSAEYRPGFGTPEFGWITPIFDIVAAVLPSFLSGLFDAFKAAPGWPVLFGSILAFALVIGGWLQTATRDRMRAIANIPARKPEEDMFDRISSIRHWPIYRSAFHKLKYWILPSLCALLMVIVGAGLLLQLAFSIYDSRGNMCADANVSGVEGGKAVFTTSSPCTRLNMSVVEEQSYRVAIAVKEPWVDVGYSLGLDCLTPKVPASPLGFEKGSLIPFIAWRRVMTAKWMAPVIRIGASGRNDYPVDLVRDPDQALLYIGRFKARTSGEVFVFVNDAIPLSFRKANEGTATIVIERIDAAH